MVHMFTHFIPTRKSRFSISSARAQSACTRYPTTRMSIRVAATTLRWWVQLLRTLAELGFASQSGTQRVTHFHAGPGPGGGGLLSHSPSIKNGVTMRELPPRLAPPPFNSTLAGRNTADLAVPTPGG